MVVNAGCRVKVNGQTTSVSAGKRISGWFHRESVRLSPELAGGARAVVIKCVRSVSAVNATAHFMHSAPGVNASACVTLSVRRI